MPIAHCQVVFVPETSGGSEFHFPINPGSITVSYSRSVTQVPILGLGEVILPGSMAPASISFEALLPRPEAYDDMASVCNYRVTEKPEESVDRLERWMGRTKLGQANPEVLRVEITGSGFSRQMVLTEVSAEYRPGEPDALYVRVSLREWRAQSVKITVGQARPLLPERARITRGSRVSDPEKLDEDLPVGSRVPPDGDPFWQPAPTHHTTRKEENYNTLWKAYGSLIDQTIWLGELKENNVHLFQPGGKYFQKYDYFDLNEIPISREHWEYLRNSAPDANARRQIEATRALKYVDCDKLNRLPPIGRVFCGLPFPCTLKLPVFDTPSAPPAATTTSSSEPGIPSELG